MANINNLWYNVYMLIRDKQEMLNLGRSLSENLTLPAVFELVGDVGVGKTTFTRGLATALGIPEPVTSPSFTISKRYIFSRDNQPCELVHYDFYRLDDPGLMSDELAETLSQPNAIVVIEWGGDVANLLPPSRYQLNFSLQEDGSRLINIIKPSQGANS